MVGFIKAIPRALVSWEPSGSVVHIKRGQYDIELQEYMGDWYAYAVTCDNPAQSFRAVRHGVYNMTEHQMVVELVEELLEF